MLSAASWELPMAEEYKDDLVQPCFLNNGSGESSLAVVSSAPSKPDPNGPAIPDQWQKVGKMVARPRST